MPDAFWLNPDWGEQPNLRSGGTAFWMRDPAPPVLERPSPQAPCVVHNDFTHVTGTALGLCPSCKAPRLHVAVNHAWQCMTCGHKTMWLDDYAAAQPALPCGCTGDTEGGMAPYTGWPWSRCKTCGAEWDSDVPAGRKLDRPDSEISYPK